MKKQLTFTVGITTCYGEDSILDTVKSIKESTNVGKFKFIIIADRVPINAKLKKELKSYGISLIENSKESGQIKKKKQILDMCTTDVIIFTQDDVIFKKNTISKIINYFSSNPKTTFISVYNEPIKATTLMEAIISIGTRISYGIAKNWNNGSNYLAIVGRCEAFKVSFAKKNFRFINRVVSTDAFFYFENKKHNGEFKYLSEASILFKNPKTLTEHLRKSSRFQNSHTEMRRYFAEDMLDYSVPKLAVVRAIIEELINDPIKVILYFLIFGYTRALKVKADKSLNPIWENDLSTKKVLPNNN